MVDTFDAEHDAKLVAGIQLSECALGWPDLKSARKSLLSD
jgi:hypothetical protein